MYLHKQNKKITNKEKAILLSAVLAIIMIIIAQPISNNLFRNASENIKSFIATIITYIGCCTFSMILINMFNYSNNNKRITIKTLLLCLPFIIVALNNFPYASYLQGTLVLDCKLYEFILYLVMCVLISTFEELIFRKLLFLSILKQTKTKKRYLYSITLSSFIFAVLHLINLIGGASFLPTLLQVGYSFLIGMMLCLILLISNNIVLCIIIHSIYNILGLSTNYFSTGYHVDGVTIIITACTSIFAFIWGIFLVKKYSQDNQ